MLDSIRSRRGRGRSWHQLIFGIPSLDEFRISSSPLTHPLALRGPFVLTTFALSHWEF